MRERYVRGHQPPLFNEGDVLALQGIERMVLASDLKSAQAGANWVAGLADRIQRYLALTSPTAPKEG